MKYFSVTKSLLLSAALVLPSACDSDSSSVPSDGVEEDGSQTADPDAANKESAPVKERLCALAPKFPDMGLAKSKTNLMLDRMGQGLDLSVASTVVNDEYYFELLLAEGKEPLVGEHIQVGTIDIATDYSNPAAGAVQLFGAAKPGFDGKPREVFIATAGTIVISEFKAPAAPTAPAPGPTGASFEPNSSDIAGLVAFNGETQEDVGEAPGPLQIEGTIEPMESSQEAEESTQEAGEENGEVEAEDDGEVEAEDNGEVEAEVPVPETAQEKVEAAKKRAAGIKVRNLRIDFRNIVLTQTKGPNLTAETPERCRTYVEGISFNTVLRVIDETEAEVDRDAPKPAN